MFNQLTRNYVASILSFGSAILCLPTFATIVEFQTSQGNIQVNLFDETTPKTVENFLTYVNNGSYTDSIVHRSMPNFIWQGGGFTYDGSAMQSVPANDPVINEPVYSNVRGTIAMAKLGSSKDSATNQWFFNFRDNSNNLDVQNGGFTVFGQVIESDLEKVDLIAAIQTCNFGGAFTNLPLVDFDCNGTTNVATENLVTINQIIIIDSSSVTAENLTPAKNTLIKPVTPTTPTNPVDTPKSDGGSITWMLLILVSGLSFRQFNPKV